MKTAKKDAVRRAIMDGLTNYEIRRDIDGRLSDRYIDQMRSEDPLIEGAMQAIFPEIAQEGEAVEMEESGEDAAPETEAPEDEPEWEAELPGPEATDEIPEEEDGRKIGGGFAVTRIDLSGVMLYTISQSGLRIGPKNDYLFVPAEELERFAGEINRLKEMHRAHFAQE